MLDVRSENEILVRIPQILNYFKQRSQASLTRKIGGTKYYYVLILTEIIQSTYIQRSLNQSVLRAQNRRQCRLKSSINNNKKKKETEN